MRNKKTLLQKLSPLATLPIILLVCFFLWQNLLPKQTAVNIKSEEGVWDLRECDFSSTTVDLGGKVEYISGALLTPAEFSARESEAVVGYMPMPGQYGTSRLRILLPENQWYTFTRVSTDFSQRTYIGGELISEVGTPGSSRETDIPNTMRVTFTVQAVGGEIEIIQQSSNFVHRDGGYHQHWMIGSNQLAQTIMVDAFTTSLVMGIYLALFLIYLLLFFMLGNYRPNLYFAGICLMWFLRMGTMGPKIFSILLPWLGWYAKFRIEYIALPVTAALTIALIHSLFPDVLHKLFLRIFYVVCGVFMVLFLWLDTLTMSLVMPVLQGVCVAVILYILLCFAVRLRKVNLEQGVFLCGMALFLYAALRDFLFYNNIKILPPFVLIDLTQISMLILAFCEATAVFIATMKEHETTKDREQKLTAENAVLDQMNHLKTEIMSTISHEARTPLAVLASYSGLVAMELRDKGMDTQTTADLDKIAFEAKRVAELIDSMKRLTLHTEERLKRVPLDLGELTLQTTKLYRHILERKGVALKLLLEPSLPPVLASPEELTQVLLNILQNAKNHTTHGSVSVAATKQDGMVVVSVEDTGTGIPPELLPHVFERGIHVHGSGTGLGLSICKELVHSHGGTIAIESEENKGTKVTFTLPIYREGEQNGA